MRMMEEQKKNSSDCASNTFGVGSTGHSFMCLILLGWVAPDIWR
jgi:hypothetical protein